DSGGSDPIAAPLAAVLLRAVAGAHVIAGEPLPGDPDALERLRPAIAQLRRDPANAPSAEAAARLCALAPAYFSRRFGQLLGMPWSDYVRTHRLHLASQRLLEGDQTVADIAYALGFATPSHFGDVFHRRSGRPPTAYRRAGPPQAGATPRAPAAPSVRANAPGPRACISPASASSASTPSWRCRRCATGTGWRMSARGPSARRARPVPSAWAWRRAGRPPASPCGCRGRPRAARRRGRGGTSASSRRSSGRCRGPAPARR